MPNEMEVPQVREYVLYRLHQLSSSELRCFEKILDALTELRKEADHE